MTPTNENCPWCEEPIHPEDAVRFMTHVEEPLKATRHQYHNECLVRSIVGSLAHQLGRCSCCGGLDVPLPASVSKRQEAIAAFAYWHQFKLPNLKENQWTPAPPGYEDYPGPNFQQ